jgi:DNA-directed RNA polymerase subunit RPC12/RpoP
MIDIKFATWEDVGLSYDFMCFLKSDNLCSESKLDQLVLDLVLGKSRRVLCNYHCGVCGHLFKTTKSTDDYSQCERCMSRSIHAEFFYNTLKHMDPVRFGSDDYVRLIMRNMIDKYNSYYGGVIRDEQIFNLQFRSNCFGCRFLGGELYHDPVLSRSIIRASLLVPFIWDKNFDWSRGVKGRQDTGSYLIPTVQVLLEG